MKRRHKERIAGIVDRAERFFGQKVVRATAPGGSGRSSYRLIFEDRTVIATLRPNFRRTHLEAFVLKRLAQDCGDTPECLGVDGELMFQSDVGGERLNLAIAEATPERRLALASEAIAAIFRIQEAGRKQALQNALPHLGQNRDWIDNLVQSTAALAEFSRGRSAGLDHAALATRLDFPGRQFVKWDCRSGNAAIGTDGRLRWFDFEYSGARHGAEDIAWLIGDEAWPLSPAAMEQVVIDCFDPGCGHDRDAYLDYLAFYLTFHCIQRFKLIVKEARKRGWIAKARVRKYDDAGVHPEFAVQICRVGAYFASRRPDTAPIGRDFEETGTVFLNILKDGLRQAETVTA